MEQVSLVPDEGAVEECASAVADPVGFQKSAMPSELRFTLLWFVLVGQAAEDWSAAYRGVAH
ncbi:hypothetical protein [Saccharothrix sp. Mg75]|uniref:hypothetical protein n=1 Tax=Saccharothrix sp. Mg75 TaxID=3445357 RepID=UPI003EE827EB